MNSNTNYGRALMDSVASAVPAFGRVFVVMNSNDSSDPNYSHLSDVFQGIEGVAGFYTDLATAYAATASGNNDVIVLDAHTSHKVSSMLTISNNKVHFIGFDGGGRNIGARTLISNTGTGASTDVSMVKVTGTGCSFHNIKFANNWSVAQNLSAVLEYGANNLYVNCDIENLGSAHLTNNAAASLILAGAECIFRNCTIGQDTLLVTSTGGQQMLIQKGTSTRAATRCLFENCIFQAYTSDTTHVFIRVAAATDVDRWNSFKNCEFYNALNVGSDVTMAVAVATPGSMSGMLTFSFPGVYNATDLATAAVGNTGVYVVGPAASTEVMAVQAS